MVRVDTPHTFARALALGIPQPWSSAASASARSVNFTVGGRHCRHAHFITRVLIFMVRTRIHCAVGSHFAEKRKRCRGEIKTSARLVSYSQRASASAHVISIEIMLSIAVTMTSACAWRRVCTHRRRPRPYPSKVGTRTASLIAASLCRRSNEVSAEYEVPSKA